ncbi:MAG: DUF945 family protein [Gammaproteobacteria bacterium]|nr:DUF945 family protein [Gammaproteobacteria bacterium]MDE0442518.1 DUF945 family protein [Gammaproteobacteria bacterium]
MKRIAIAVVAMVVVLAVAMPPLFGARARSLMEDQLATVGDSLAPYVKVEVSFDDWNIGWYSSTATVSLAMTFESPALQADMVESYSTTLPKSVTLYHGPILFRPSPGLGWGSVEFVVDSSVVSELREFEEATGVAYAARGGVLVGFGGGLSMSMDVPGFEYTQGESDLSGTEFDFGGLEATAKFGGSGGNIEVDGRFAGVNATIFPMQFAWGRTTWTGSAWKDDRIPNLWRGRGRTEVARVMFSSSSEGNTYEVTDLRIEGDNEIEGDFLVGTNLYEAREARIGDISLQDLVMDLAVRYGLDGMARLMDVAYFDSLDPERQMAIATDLVRERVDFAINRLGFMHEDRQALASLAIEFRGDELPDAFEIGPNADFMAMLPLVTANLDLAFHRELLGGLGTGQMDGVVRMLVREGIVQESGDDYALNVGFANGGLTVNGDPFEPFELMGLLGGP